MGFDISFDCESIDLVAPRSGSGIAVSLTGADLAEVLDCVSYADIIDNTDLDGLLDEIGDQRMIDYLTHQGYLVTEE